MLPVQLPDGSVVEHADDATPLDVAAKISDRLAKAVIAAKVDGRIVDASRPLAEATDQRPVELKLLTDRDPEALGVLRHSCAHVMARAVMRLYPSVSLAFGPTLANGYYYDFDLPQTDLNGAQPGDLVMCEIQPARGIKRKKVRVIEVIGREDDPKAISLIAIHSTGLRSIFPPKVIDETNGMKVPTLKDRDDLTKLPLVTIDGVDARDFDDAVYAERTDDGGFHLLVAIADVAFYVKPGSALDVEAFKRGNST